MGTLFMMTLSTELLASGMALPNQTTTCWPVALAIWVACSSAAALLPPICNDLLARRT